MSRTPSYLDEATLADIEGKLARRLARLTESLEIHEHESSALLPADSEEAAPVVEEIGRIEAEEERESDEILLIQQALERLQAGTYGSCLECDRAIAVRRLQTVPHAPLCFECQEKEESARVS